MNSSAKEINFDGLVGPTHNYSGLSFGNIASTGNRQTIANPREAALQGLEKMKFLSSLGVVQGVLPPHERPYIPILRALGYGGKDEEIWRKAACESPELICACSSAAAMWTANAATVSPSRDSSDSKVHFTPANLTAKLHRSLEAPATSRILKALFKDPLHFVHHDPLPGGSYFSDEGAANHTRFCSSHGEPGVQLFVWGRSSLQARHAQPSRFPARQTLEASQAIARRHLLDSGKTVFAQQNPLAIDAGVFHNDVISVGNQDVFLFHEEAFVSPKEVIEELSRKMQETCNKGLTLICVGSKDISLEEAVKTYLFNSQIISIDDRSMVMIAPAECEQNKHVHAFLDGLVRDKTNPINHIHYLHLRESMRNGGGPACLRLRVVLTQQELRAVHPRAILDNELYMDLKKWIVKNYRDKLLPRDLADPKLLEETRYALDELTTILKLGPLYEFQQ